jgi:hypothetical protein
MAPMGHFTVNRAREEKQKAVSSATLISHSGELSVYYFLFLI